MADSIIDPNNNKAVGTNDRHYVTMIVLIFSFASLLILAILVICSNWNATKDTQNEPTQRLFNTVLPVFGTWVGTLLAYYFSKDNFEAASRSLNDMAKSVTGMDKLKTVLVKDKMIPKSQILTLPPELAAKADNDTLTLKEITDFLDAQKRYRLPVFDKTTAIQYIIHKSMIDEFKRKKTDEAAATPAVTTATLANLKLSDLLKDSNYKKLFETSFGLVPVTATLADAKQKMDGISNCEDVFVTQTGAKTEPVMGWITDDVLAENAKV